MRWLATHGHATTASEAPTLLRNIATELTHRTGSPVTPWMANHAIWLAARNPPPKQSRSTSAANPTAYAVEPDRVPGTQARGMGTIAF